MPHLPAFLTGLFPKFFTRGNAVVEPASLRDAPRLSQLHRASFHRGWGADEFEQILIERNALAHRLLAMLPPLPRSTRLDSSPSSTRSMAGTLHQARSCLRARVR